MASVRLDAAIFDLRETEILGTHRIVVRVDDPTSGDFALLVFTHANFVTFADHIAMAADEFVDRRAGDGIPPKT